MARELVIIAVAIVAIALVGITIGSIYSNGFFGLFRVNGNSQQIPRNTLSPNQLSLLLLGDPLYSYYNGSAMLYQIHQVPFKNGSIYQFAYPNGTIYKTIVEYLSGKYIRYTIYDPSGPISNKVIPQNKCKRWPTPNGGLGNYTYIVHMCEQPFNTYIYNYSEFGSLNGIKQINSSDIQMFNTTNIIFNTTNMLEVPTNDNYVSVQYFFQNGTLFRTMYSTFSCLPRPNETVIKMHENMTQICNTTDAYYKPASAYTNVTPLNSTNLQILNKSLNGFTSPFVYETVQNSTNGTKLVKFFSKYLNESVINDLNNNITYSFNTKYVGINLTNFPSNNTLLYDICYYQRCLKDYVVYNESTGVIYANGSIDTHPTADQISEAYYVRDGYIGDIPLYTPLHSNFSLSAENYTDEYSNCNILLENSSTSGYLTNITFNCGYFNSNLNLINYLGSSFIYIWNASGNGTKHTALNLQYSIGPNSNQVFINYDMSGINEELEQSYGGAGFGDQIELSVSNSNGTKETESQKFQVPQQIKNILVQYENTTFSEQGIPSNYNWTVELLNSSGAGMAKAGQKIVIRSQISEQNKEKLRAFAYVGNLNSTYVGPNCNSGIFNVTLGGNVTVPPYSSWNCTTIIWPIIFEGYTVSVIYDGINKTITYNTSELPQFIFYTPPGNYSFKILNDDNGTCVPIEIPSSGFAVAGSIYNNINATEKCGFSGNKIVQ